MGSPLSDEYPARLKRWRLKGIKPRDARYYHQLYVSRPKWADTNKVREIYAECKRRNWQGEDCVVDHIVPLFHPHVCGLNWEGNLEIVPYKKNEAKSNHTWPDSWHASCEFDFEEEPYQFKLNV